MRPPPLSYPALAERRGWLVAAAALAVAPLAGCGFELRRAPTLNFRTLQLTGFKPNSPFEKELREKINASQTTLVVESAAQAQVILEAISDRREKNVVATTSSGQVVRIPNSLSATSQPSTTTGRLVVISIGLIRRPRSTL